MRTIYLGRKYGHGIHIAEEHILSITGIEPTSITMVDGTRYECGISIKGSEVTQDYVIGKEDFEYLMGMGRATLELDSASIKWDSINWVDGHSELVQISECQEESIMIMHLVIQSGGREFEACIVTEGEATPPEILLEITKEQTNRLTDKDYTKLEELGFISSGMTYGSKTSTWLSSN